MKNKIYYLLIALVIVFFYFAIDVAVEDQQQQLTLPVADLKIHLKDYSEHNKKLRQKRIEQKKQAGTPEGKASLSKYWNRMVSIQSSAIQPVEFYARVVDQYNQPVSDAVVNYKADGVYLATGTGFGKTTTDADGFFNLNTVKGASFYIKNIQKQGYDFHTVAKGFKWVTFESTKRGADSKAGTDYPQEKPYLFKAWKIEHNDKLISEYSEYHAFYPEQIYSMALVNEQRRKFKGQGKGSFELLFTRSSKKWLLKLSAPQGGFIENNDLYMNLAPESGYQESITVGGKYNNFAKLNKQFYLKTSKGKYAKLIMEITPYFNKKKSAFELDYTINLDGNRNLAIVEDMSSRNVW